MAKHENIHAGIEKTGNGFARMTNRRFTTDIERRIDQHRAPSELVKRSEQRMQRGIFVRTDSLHASRIIEMRDRRNIGA